MKNSQRFAISIHALTLLASSSEPLTSGMIAGSVDTNPVVIRRALAGLRRHGLVGSRPGAGGGWRLLRAPEEIHLYDVYRSLGEEDVLAVHDHPNKYCPIGRNITGVLENTFSSAQAALVDSLRGHTIADVLQDVRARTK